MDQEQDQERYEQTIRLLEATHEFPCPFLIKVIGRTENDFVNRVVAALRAAQQLDEDPPFRTRETPHGRHICVTLEPTVTSAEEALAIYRWLRQVDGIVTLM